MCFIYSLTQYIVDCVPLRYTVTERRKHEESTYTDRVESQSLL